MASETSTERKRLLLKPREASLYDIFGVLFSADLEGKKFIHKFSVKKTIIERRGVLFLSLLIQKTLQKHEKIMSCVGSTVETSLNVLANKRDLLMFLKNIVRGKVVTPDKNAARYASMIGLLDKRVEFGKNINPGSQKYLASLCAMASKLAYENQEFIENTVVNIWKMKLLGSYSFWDDRYEGYTTQCFMFQDKYTNPDVIIVAFRGTEPLSADDWCTDVDLSFIKLPNIKGKLHTGFMNALGLKPDGTWPPSPSHKYAYQTITEHLKSHLNANDRMKFIVTGHSLGGALAVLYPAVLVQHNEIKVLERLQTIYTFGQPRVGDMKFGKFMNDQFEHYGVGYYRFVYSHDVVPRIPFDHSALMYKHFGKCIYINCLYEASLVEEEPMKNYFEWGKSLVTKRIDAIWEFGRSFVLPYMFGPEYKESLLQQMFRIFGLVFPGIPAHGPVDYINATRLANY